MLVGVVDEVLVGVDEGWGWMGAFWGAVGVDERCWWEVGVVRGVGGKWGGERCWWGG